VPVVDQVKVVEFVGKVIEAGEAEMLTEIEFTTHFVPSQPVPVAQVTEMDNAFVALCCGELLSTTLTVKLDIPAVVGVPLIIPEVVRLSPIGRLPLAIDHV